MPDLNNLNTDYGLLITVYNLSHRATITWVGFAAATVLLIIAVAGGRNWARRAGLTLLALTTLALLAGFIVRWVLSGRPWYLPPIMNLFEAIVASALVPAVLAIVIEKFWRKNVIGLAAAFYATAVTLAGFIFPQPLGGGIAAMPGILNSPIMAIHVSSIIIGHALVGMTFCISVVYLLALLWAGNRAGAWSSGADLSPNRLASGYQGVLATIDRCNLIVTQLAAWMVIMGTVLGAYWADFAWGHWWDWDIKETWALITCLAFISILHLRHAVGLRWRGVLTAIFCIVGCAIMLFNWLAVNIFFTGKHSYA